MNSTGGRTSRFEIELARDDAFAVIERACAYVGSRFETVALYVLACAVWGLVVFCAVDFALQ